MISAESARFGQIRPRSSRLRDTLTAHHTDGGVYFDSRAWIITARRRSD
jgi:hypothetical protein